MLHAYPEDRFTKIPKKKIGREDRIWIMWVTKPTSHHPQGGHPCLIRRPVEYKPKWYSRKKEIRWERIPDDPRISEEQVMKWAMEAVDYINKNLDADFPHRIEFSSVGRSIPWITFEDDYLPAR